MSPPFSFFPLFPLPDKLSSGRHATIMHEQYRVAMLEDARIQNSFSLHGTQKLVAFCSIL